MGTPTYMAPEQAAGHLDEVGPAADVYSLGVMLYEMLAGRPPFIAQSDVETLRQIHQDEPLPVRRLQPQVPSDLETICQVCMEKEPARRYATAGALADDLDRFLHDQPINVRPPTLWRQGRLWMRRHPAQAVIVATFLALAIALPTGLFWHTLQLQRERQLALAAQVAAEESAQIAREDEAKIRQHVYVADMRVAQQLRQDGDLASLPAILDRYRPKTDASPLGPAPRSAMTDAAADTRAGVAVETARDMRGFEWHCLNRFRDVIRLRLHAHSGEVDVLAFSARGDVLATACLKDGLVR
jgi:hypothetical protein